MIRFVTRHCKLIKRKHRIGTSSEKHMTRKCSLEEETAEHLFLFCFLSECIDGKDFNPWIFSKVIDNPQENLVRKILKRMLEFLGISSVIKPSMSIWDRNKP